MAHRLCAVKLTLAAAGLLIVDVAEAQSAKPAARPAPPRKPPPSSAEERAFTLYEQGRAAFREGRYSEAVVLLLESQRLQPEPVLDFNIGKAYEALGESAKAISHYETFLKNVADVPDRAEIEANVVLLKKSLAPKESAPIAPVIAPAPIVDVADGPSPIPWIIAGLGLAGLGVGAGLGAAASSTNDDVASAPNQIEGSELRSSAEGLALGANLAFGIGGAVLAGGVIWGIVDVTSGSSNDDAGAAVTARIGPTWAELAITFE